MFQHPTGSTLSIERYSTVEAPSGLALTNLQSTQAPEAVGPLSAGFNIRPNPHYRLSDTHRNIFQGEIENRRLKDNKITGIQFQVN
jgi:hypothetical protein